jgi:transcriptional regulator with XRE-family HTH domain
MTKKPSKSRSIPPDSAEAERIRYLLEHRWGGNQNEMARAIRCSQSSLSRVVSGKLRPGKRLLNLVTDFGVSREWLTQGKGEPLAERPNPSGATDFRLPVVTDLVPGSPAEHGDRLQGHEFPVAPALYSKSRCWYEVPEGAGILRNEEVRLMSHDLLLLEYDLGRFHDLFEMDRRIAVAWVTSSRDVRHLEVGVLEYFIGPDEETLALVVGEPDFRRWKEVKYVGGQIVKKDRTSGRLVRLGDTTVPVLVTSEGNMERLPDNMRQPIVYRISRPDVVAVSMGMFRRW